MFKKKKKQQNEEQQIEEALTESLGEVKRQKKKLPGWVIIPVLVALVLVFYGASKLSGGKTQTTSLQAVKVEKGDIKEVYNTSGTIESERIKVFYSPVNAPVLTCNAKTGQSVKAGDMLVVYDTTNLERDNQQSQLNALSTKYTNQDAAEQSSRAANSAAKAEAQTANAIQNLQNQIKQKEAEVNQLQQEASASAGTAAQNAAKAAEIGQKMQENLNNQSTKKAEKENIERQLEGMTGGTAEYEKLQEEAAKLTTQCSNLEIEYRNLEGELASVGAVDSSDSAAALSAASQELSSLKASLTELQNSAGVTADTGLTGAQVKSMQVSENLAELATLSTEELLAKGKEGIKAEFAGIISDVKAVEGSDAMQGGELFTIVSNQDVVVKLEVSANDFDNLSEGNQALVKVGKKTYKGTLTAIDKIALPNEKGNPVIGAKIRIDNPDEDIFIGVGAKVSMTVAEKKNVLCLPNEVVNTSTDGDFVYIIQNGTVKKQMVELGVASSSKVEILGGLKEGSEVVSDVSGDLAEGMKATAVLAEDAAGKE